jgi:hypothetical protein
MILVVVHPFGAYKKGDKIVDAAEVEKILASHPQMVVKVGPPKP